MLGRFLELALVTDDTGAAWQNWRALGFADAATGDIWPHAYGVLTCEGLAIGLHAAGDEALSLVFVRPEVAALHRELQARGVKVEHARLGADVFNQLMLREPGGTALRVLESRSFSPPLEDPQSTALGRFATISLPARNPDAAQEFWTRLGFQCKPSTLREWPDQAFAVDGVPISVHPHSLLPEPALLFQQPSRRDGSTPTADESTLDHAGFSTGKSRPGLPPDSKLLRTAEGLAVLLFH